MGNDFVRLLIFLGLSISQWTLGYYQLKKLGFLLPIIFYVWVFTIIYPHLYKLTLLKAPVLLILLILSGAIFYSAWQSGFKEKEKKITNEIEKMKARDIQK